MPAPAFHPAAYATIHAIARCPLVLEMQQVEEGCTQEGFGFEAHDRTHRGADVGEAPLCVDDRDDIARLLQEGTEVRLARLKRRLGQSKTCDKPARPFSLQDADEGNVEEGHGRVPREVPGRREREQVGGGRAASDVPRRHVRPIHPKIGSA